MFQRILVGTDGSGTAAHAVAHAVELAKVTGAELLVISAYSSPKDAPPQFSDSSAAPGVEISRGLLQDVEKRYGGDVKLRTVMREGSPADAIIEVAEEENIDLIIVGNKGMTGARRFVLGSVPNAVTHHAPSHVLIVHTTD
jgi:nucleotide-binding universal stress UspA family protein